VSVGTQNYSSAGHIAVLVYPNPLSPAHYVVLNSVLHIRRARVHGRLRHAAIRRLRSVEARSGAWVRGRAGGLFRRVLESCGKVSREGPVSDGIETVGGKYQSATGRYAFAHSPDQSIWAHWITGLTRPQIWWRWQVMLKLCKLPHKTHGRRTASPNDPGYLGARRRLIWGAEAALFTELIHDADRCLISAANFVELSIVVEAQIGPDASRQCDIFFPQSWNHDRTSHRRAGPIWLARLSLTSARAVTRRAKFRRLLLLCARQNHGRASLIQGRRLQKDRHFVDALIAGSRN